MIAKQTADHAEALGYEIACNERTKEEDAYRAECERHGLKPEKPKRLNKTETCIRIGTQKGVQMCQPKIDALKRELEAAKANGGAANAEVLAMLKMIERNTARLAGECETKRERKSAAAKKAAAANRDKVHDDEIAAALEKVHANVGNDKAKIAFWCRKVIAEDGLQVRGRGGVYKPMPSATLARYYRTYRNTHGGI